MMKAGAVIGGVMGLIVSGLFVSLSLTLYGIPVGFVLWGFTILVGILVGAATGVWLETMPTPLPKTELNAVDRWFMQEYWFGGKKI